MRGVTALVTSGQRFKAGEGVAIWTAVRNRRAARHRLFARRMFACLSQSAGFSMAPERAARVQ